MTVSVGSKVPGFSAAATGGTFDLAAQSGSVVVLYFYPKDDTPGCTTEGAAFRDAYPRFRQAGAIVAGVSRDSLKSHERFKTKMDFPFELISDPDEALCAAFGYFPALLGVARLTQLLDAVVPGASKMSMGECRYNRPAAAATAANQTCKCTSATFNMYNATRNRMLRFKTHP